MQIENLMDELEIAQLSDVPSAEVTGHSENAEMQQSKIQWLGTEGQLIYLVKSLIEKDFLPKFLADQPFAFIARHFLNSKGKPFKNTQGSQSYYQYDGNKNRKPTKAEIINQIIEGMEKQPPKDWYLLIGIDPNSLAFTYLVSLHVNWFY